jgi:hypothetical protein
MTNGAEHRSLAHARWRRRASLEEQAQAEGMRPIGDGSSYLGEDLFAEPGELEEFLEHVRWGRDLSIPGGVR